MGITVDGVHSFDEKTLADITYSRSVGDKALRGVVTQCLSFRAYSQYDLGLSEGASVRLSSSVGSFPTFYIANVTRDGNVYTITAYDCCKNLDIPFDYTNYDQYDSSGEKTSAHIRWYPSSDVLGDLAHQCGFSHSSPSMARVTRLCFKSFEGMTCRQILDDLSIAECGFWYCTASDQLAFQIFSPDLSANVFTVDDEDRTEIKVLGTKTISDIFCEDETYGIISKQTSTDWKNTETISGRYMDAANAAGVAAQVLAHRGQYVYTGWNGEMIVDFVEPINSSIYYGSVYLPCYEQRYSIAPVTVAAFSAAKPDTSYSQYQSLYSRQLAGKVTLNRSMGNFFINDTGSGVRMKL